MKLSNLCDIGFNMSEADFYIYAKGSEKSLGMPTTDPSDSKYKIGIKVKEEAKDNNMLKKSSKLPICPRTQALQPMLYGTH
jgi:hypothetical protein